MNKKLLFLASAASVVALAACNASVTDTTDADLDDESYSSMSDDMIIDDTMMDESSSVDAMDASSSEDASSAASL